MAIFAKSTSPRPRDVATWKVHTMQMHVSQVLYCACCTRSSHAGRPWAESEPVLPRLVPFGLVAATPIIATITHKMATTGMMVITRNGTFAGGNGIIATAEVARLDLHQETRLTCAKTRGAQGTMR